MGKRKTPAPQINMSCILKGTWQWGGFSGVFAEIGSSWVPYTTFRAVPILASNSRRYSYSKNDFPLSPIRGVANSAYQCYRESPTPRITDTRSHQLPASLIRGVGDSPHHRYGESAIEFFKRKLSVSMIRRVVDSPHQWYGESTTPRIVESESRRLRVSPIRRVDDSAYRWVGELMTPRIGDTGSCYSKKKLIWCQFSGLLTAKPCLYRTNLAKNKPGM